MLYTLSFDILPMNTLLLANLLWSIGVLLLWSIGISFLGVAVRSLDESSNQEKSQSKC